MTFFQLIENELLNKDIKEKCCEKSQLYSALIGFKFFHSNSIIYIQNLEYARKISQNISTYTKVISEIETTERKRGYPFKLLDDYNKNEVYKYFKHNQNCDEINLEVFKKKCCQKAFLKGIFLSSGNIYDPEKQYKIEFKIKNENLANNIINFINSIDGLNFNLKLTDKKGSSVLYCKDSTQIQDFLFFIGAKKSAMELMQTKMYKEELNKINRISNFETSNMDKTFTASVKQVLAIVKIEEEKGLDFLSTELREVAELRLDNPQMSLKTISEILNISRSAVNHRLQKIISISEKFKKE